MKNKFLMPALAILIAMASAFATPITNQMGWYDANGAEEEGGAVQAEITTPANSESLCSVISEGQICKIRVGFVDHEAFATAQDAETANPDGLLRYD
jgi:hypothetical protein